MLNVNLAYAQRWTHVLLLKCSIGELLIWHHCTKLKAIGTVMNMGKVCGIFLNTLAFCETVAAPSMYISMGRQQHGTTHPIFLGC